MQVSYLKFRDISFSYLKVQFVLPHHIEHFLSKQTSNEFTRININENLRNSYQGINPKKKKVKSLFSHFFMVPQKASLRSVKIKT